MIASTSESLNIWPNAGIAPSLPFLMRLRMNSSSRWVSISWGPLPAERPPSLWQKPQLAANSSLTSRSECADTPLASCAARSVVPVTANRPATASIRRPAFIRSGAASFQAVDDEHTLVPRHALVGLTEVRCEFVAEHAAETGHHGNILLTAGRIADDAALM